MLVLQHTYHHLFAFGTCLDFFSAMVTLEIGTCLDVVWLTFIISPSRILYVCTRVQMSGRNNVRISIHKAFSLSASLEPLAHCWNMASLSLFCWYYFGRCSSELDQLVSLPFSQERSTCYSDRLHDFSVIIPRCYKDVYVNSFFPRTARLWNSVPIECFPLNYDLSGCKSRINRHLLTVGSSKTDFLYTLIFLCL